MVEADTSVGHVSFSKGRDSGERRGIQPKWWRRAQVLAMYSTVRGESQGSVESYNPNDEGRHKCMPRIVQ